jgi:hypothetical protein
MGLLPSIETSISFLCERAARASARSEVEALEAFDQITMAALAAPILSVTSSSRSE